MGRIEFTPDYMLDTCIQLFAKVHGMTKEDTASLFERSGLDSSIRKFYIEIGHKGYEDMVAGMRSFLDIRGYDCPPRVMPGPLPPLFDYRC